MKLFNLGLVEAIIVKHKAQWGLAATYQRGKDPIDGIYISPNLQILEGRYYPFGEAPSDYRAL